MSAALKVTNLLSNALTGNGSATALGRSKNINIFVRWPTGTSAGSVVLEQAPYKEFAGTWSNLTTFTWATANSIDSFRGTGPFGAIRARIGTTVVSSGDGVYVEMWEN